jgi:hypothetical protein
MRGACTAACTGACIGACTGACSPARCGDTLHRSSGHAGPGTDAAASLASDEASPAAMSATGSSAPASPRRRPPTPKKLRDVMDLYPPETLRTINSIRTTRARGRGRGGSLLTEEPTKFEEANTEEC